MKIRTTVKPAHLSRHRFGRRVSIVVAVGLALGAGPGRPHQPPTSGAPLTIAATGGLTVTGSVTPTSGPYFSEEDVTLTPTAPLTALTIAVTVRKTPGVAYARQYNTFWYSNLASSHTETADALVYTFTLRPGQIVPPSSGLRVAAQFSGNGTPHDSSADTYTVVATSGGASSIYHGSFGSATAPPPTPTPALLTASGSRTANSGPYFSEEDVLIETTAPLTALSITVTVSGQVNPRGPQNTIAYLGQYNTFPTGTLAQSYRADTYNLGPGTPSVVRSLVYTYTLAPGHTLPAGSRLLVGAQFSAVGTHYYSSDSYTVTATSSNGGVNTTSGAF